MRSSQWSVEGIRPWPMIFMPSVFVIVIFARLVPSERPASPPLTKAMLHKDHLIMEAYIEDSRCSDTPTGPLYPRCVVRISWMPQLISRLVCLGLGFDHGFHLDRELFLVDI